MELTRTKLMMKAFGLTVLCILLVSCAQYVDTCTNYDEETIKMLSLEQVQTVDDVNHLMYSIGFDLSEDIDEVNTENNAGQNELFGIIANGISIEDANQKMPFPLLSFEERNDVVRFLGATLYGDVNNNVPTIATLSYVMQIDEREIGFELTQVYYTNSIYSEHSIYGNDVSDIYLSSLQVFAGVYSGLGRNNLDIETVIVREANAYFAFKDFRVPIGNGVVISDSHSSSLYWMYNDINLILTIFYPVSIDGLITINTMIELAESMR